MSQSNSHKIFDEYEVECNDCQRYWLDQCDGTPEATERHCTSFIATKKVDIPMRVKRLENTVKTLGGCFIVTNIIMIFHLLSHILEAFK